MLNIDQSQFYNLCNVPELLIRLRDWFGIEGDALRTLEAYVKGRRMNCKVGNYESDYIDVKIGLIQGNNVAGRLASLFVCVLVLVGRKFGFNTFIYSDDCSYTKSYKISEIHKNIPCDVFIFVMHSMHAICSKEKR